MIKVYFGCAMRGGHNVVSREDLAKLPNIIEELGYAIASKHPTEIGAIEKENKLTKTEIHDRDYTWETESEIGIFEISNPSLGVGGEISDMIHMGKPVLCLFKRGLEDSVSAYTQGKKNSRFVTTLFECQSYKSPQDAQDKIKQFVEHCQLPTD